jgi:hypothetical protein
MADGARTLTATFQGNTLFESSSDSESHQVITPDQPPTAVEDGYSTNVGVPLIVTANEGVLANDSDPDGDPKTAELVDGPSRGTLVLHPDGSFEYTPSGGIGGDAFTYRVVAGGASDTAQVDIIIVN